MHRKFEINWTKNKGGCQSGRKMVTHNSKSDLPLVLPVVFCRSRQTIDGRGGGSDIDVSLGQFSKIIKLFNSPAAAK